ncbi:xylulokinase [Angustibacter sp. McL0619]|uniref:xylulokinase n=1 Tax=Angustibacter sp. McL0619 TaxID=3415676 RepID=UPI003CF165A1
MPSQSSDLVLGVDSSTQSVKALLVRADDGTVVDQRSAPHPDGTEVDPQAWLDALDEVSADLLPRAAAVAVGGQQHGMVALDAGGDVVRPALLWNDTRSAQAAQQLVQSWGGPQACAAAVGSVLVASFTATKLRWLRDHEPANAERVHQVLLPHDLLTWHLTGRSHEPTTDRGEASGTGYFSPATSAWRPDLATDALGHDVRLPRVAAPDEVVGRSASGAVVAPGTGDNMAAALGLGLRPGDVAVSVGTSGVASAVAATACADPTGDVAGFCDAAGAYLPLVCTLNAARVLDTTARLLGTDHDGLSALALDAPSGAGGVTLLPYLDGERTPNRPQARGTLHGITTATGPEHLARAAVEGLLCSLADAVDRLAGVTGVAVERVVLLGGGARSRAVRELAPAVFGRPVVVPGESEYVALGAARQAAWSLSGADAPPSWSLPDPLTFEAEPTPHVREAYARLRDRTDDWSS